MEYGTNKQFTFVQGSHCERHWWHKQRWEKDKEIIQQTVHIYLEQFILKIDFGLCKSAAQKGKSVGTAVIDMQRIREQLFIDTATCPYHIIINII